MQSCVYKGQRRTKARGLSIERLGGRIACCVFGTVTKKIFFCLFLTFFPPSPFQFSSYSMFDGGAEMPWEVINKGRKDMEKEGRKERRKRRKKKEEKEVKRYKRKKDILEKEKKKRLQRRRKKKKNPTQHRHTSAPAPILAWLIYWAASSRGCRRVRRGARPRKSSGIRVGLESKREEERVIVQSYGDRDGEGGEQKEKSDGSFLLLLLLLHTTASLLLLLSLLF